MGILSPVMSYVVDKELGFPIPSEKEKINKAIKRYRYILSQHPDRADAPEIMFGIADLLVGRNESGDYAEATKIYDSILHRNPPEYLKARALVGKSELMIGSPAHFNDAISLCEKARHILNKDYSDFFAAKTVAVESELRLSRHEKGDWEKAVKLIGELVREKHANWYFKGRAILTKAEILLYKKPQDLRTPLKLIDESIKQLHSRPDDYFTNKGKVLKAEILIRREIKGDFERAEKLLVEVVKMKFAYKDLIARAKIGLADIANHPRATKLISEVLQMEGLDPYLVEKARNAEQTMKERKRKRKKDE
ncbi:MAG: hypothetical protein QME05_02120 [Candidatus Margulisbacteria bacterium]|nr:hypothetical protein [Candidatus Margulisiibacteriota bacterium]